MDDKKGVSRLVMNYPWLIIDSFILLALLTVLAVGENQIANPSPFLRKFVVFSMCQFWLASLHLLLVTRHRMQHHCKYFDHTDPTKKLPPVPPFSRKITIAILSVRLVVVLLFSAWLFINWPN